MTRHFSQTFAAALGLLTLVSAQAGTPIEDNKGKMVVPEEDKLPYGTFTLGAKFSDNLSSVFIDGVTPFWAPGDFVMFLSTKTTLDDNSEVLSSYGLGLRYLVPGQEIIVGANVFYDGIESQYGNNFHQLGIGAEVLTRWVDARVNFYIPEGDVYETQGFSRTSNDGGRTFTFRNGRAITQRNINSRTKRSFKQYEGALTGLNAEVGFLVPGLDEYLELRLFVGYYNFDGAFSNHYEGVKARLEARVLPGIILDAEYWDDDYLMGGHWTGGVRVVIPFSIWNICQGRNPFEGTAEMFRMRKRDFRERLSESVIRSHQVMTDQSEPQHTDTKTSEEVTDTVIGFVPQPRFQRKVGAAGPGPTQTPRGAQQSAGVSASMSRVDPQSAAAWVSTLRDMSGEAFPSRVR